jgi:hypothetical protein
MTIAGRHGRGQKHQTYHHQYGWPGVAEIKVPPAHLMQKEKNADGDQDRRTHQPTNRAALAATTRMRAQESPPSIPSAHAIPQQK